ISSLGDLCLRIVALSNQLAHDPGVWLILLAMVILLAVQMLEPVWRLHALAALGLRQAAQNPNANIATSAPNILMLWGITFLIYIIPGLFVAFVLRNASLDSLAFGLVAYSLVVAVANWGLYDWVESGSLRQLEAPETVEEAPAM